MESKYGSFGLRTWALVPSFVATIVTFAWLGLSSSIVMAQDRPCWETAKEPRLEDCRFQTSGSNRYFKLEPGYQLVLEGKENGDAVHLVITVLDETESIDTRLPGVGEVLTRVVEERESVNNVLVEVSRNFFAICDETNDVVYFGEEVDICDTGLKRVRDSFRCDGGEPDHSGAWRAGKKHAKPGIMMPGTFVVDATYFQEQADGAMDCAENVAKGLEVTNAAGSFENCVQVEETTQLEPTADPSIKIYCPRVGLVEDSGIKLVRFGFKNTD